MEYLDRREVLLGGSRKLNAVDFFQLGMGLISFDLDRMAFQAVFALMTSLLLVFMPESPR
jgi:hypothetical protein